MHAFIKSTLRILCKETLLGAGVCVYEDSKHARGSSWVERKGGKKGQEDQELVVGLCILILLRELVFKNHKSYRPYLTLVDL